MVEIYKGVHIGDHDDVEREWEEPYVTGIVCCESGCECVDKAKRPVFDMRFDDGAPAPVEKIRALMTWFKKRDSILVHCRAGISRSSAISALIIARAYVFSIEDALDMVRKVRPIVRPHSRIWRSIKAHYRGKRFVYTEQLKKRVEELEHALVTKTCYTCSRSLTKELFD